MPSNTNREERRETIVFALDTALQTISGVNLGYYLGETVLNTKKFADWNFTHRVRTLARRQLRM